MRGEWGGSQRAELVYSGCQMSQIILGNKTLVCPDPGMLGHFEKVPRGEKGPKESHQTVLKALEEWAVLLQVKDVTSKTWPSLAPQSPLAGSIGGPESLVWPQRRVVNTVNYLIRPRRLWHNKPQTYLNENSTGPQTGLELGTRKSCPVGADLTLNPPHGYACWKLSWRRGGLI